MMEQLTGPLFDLGPTFQHPVDKARKLLCWFVRDKKVANQQQ
jgi:hypothetical protein